MFCKHDWVKASDIVLESGFEQIAQYDDLVSRMKNIEPYMLVKTHILLMVCKKCGKVYKSVTHSEGA